MRQATDAVMLPLVIIPDDVTYHELQARVRRTRSGELRYPLTTPCSSASNEN